jgi:hypothetical protein
MAGMAGMVEGGPVTEAALSDRRPLPRTRRRCPRQRSPTRRLGPDRRRCRRSEVLRVAELEALIAEQERGARPVDLHQLEVVVGVAPGSTV